MYGKVTNGNFGYYLPSPALAQLKSLKHLGIAGRGQSHWLPCTRLREGDGPAAWLGGLTLHHSRDGDSHHGQRPGKFPADDHHRR